LGFVDPLIALITSFIFLAILIYKRVNLGITLTFTAMFLALLSVEWRRIPTVIFETTVNPLTMSLVIATFGIMLLSQLYKETKVIDVLSESISRIVKNSKLVVSILPAIIGLLPVAGGALMSAPLVEAEAEKLGLKAEKKTYVNVWFRHTIFPVYPVSQVLIWIEKLTELALISIILRQIPVVIVMVIVGYLIGLWKTPKKAVKKENPGTSVGSELKRFIVTFSPILATIIAVVGFGVDVAVSAFIGVAVLLVIARPSLQVFTKPLKNWAIYGITLAAYGAFLMRNVVEEVGISEIFGSFVANGNVDALFLLLVIPAVLSFFIGSPLGGIAISFSILSGVVNFTPKSAALLYISAYLGYVIAPTHLCLILTAEYFKCPLGKLYKYLTPSLAVSILTAILVYILA